MPNRDDKKPWEDLDNLVSEGNGVALHEFLDSLTPAEIARSISRLEESSQASLLTLLEPEDAAVRAVETLEPLILVHPQNHKGARKTEPSSELRRSAGNSAGTIYVAPRSDAIHLSTLYTAST